MAYDSLKTAIRNAIYDNGNEEITGSVLRTVLLSIVDVVGAGYKFEGTATPSTSPSTPQYPCFWIGVKGAYANFGSPTIEVKGGELGIFMWNGIEFSKNVLKVGGDGAFDISDYTGNSYASLSAALADIPQIEQKGGMTIKYIQSLDTKYVQYRLMSDTFSTIESDWQGVDDEPTFRSRNLVESGGTYDKFNELDNLLIRTPQTITSEAINESGFVNTNGTITASGSWKHSDFLACKGGTNFTALLADGGDTAIIAFYTEANESSFIGYLEGCTGNVYNGIIPVNANYMRVSNNNILQSSPYVNYYSIPTNDSQRLLSIENNIKKLDNVLFIEPVTIGAADINISGYINTSGTVTTQGSWKHSDFLLCKAGSNFTALLANGGSSAVIGFYRESNESSFIGFVDGCTGASFNGIIPVGANYMRVSNNSALVPSPTVEYIPRPLIDSDRLLAIEDNLSQILTEPLKQILVKGFGGKKLGVIGDSIAKGAFANHQSFAYYISQYCGMTENNVAISGAELTDIYDEIDSLDSDCDIIFIEGGVNDFMNNQNSQIGEPFVVSGNKRTLNQNNTVCGQLNKICLKLRETYPTALIFLLTPLKACLSATKQGIVNSAYDKSLSGNYYFEDLQKAFVDASLIHSFPIIDLCSEALLNSMVPEMAAVYYQHIWAETGFEDYGRDLCHPTATGHQLIAKYIEGRLLTFANILI